MLSQLRRGQPIAATLAAMTAACAVLVQCTAAPPPPAATSSPSAASPSPTTPPPPPPASPSTTAPPAPARVQPVTAAEPGESCRPGCPVEPARLRRLEIDYIGLDGQTRRGELIVREDLVADVTRSFEQLSPTALPHREDAHGGPISARRRRVVHGGQQHLGLQLQRHPGNRPMGAGTPRPELSISTRFSTPTSITRAHFQPQERRAIPGSQPH